MVMKLTVMQTFVRLVMTLVLVLSATIGMAEWAMADENEYVYGHCQMLTVTTSTTAYVSSIYRVKWEGSRAQGVGIGNSFYAYVNAQYGIDRFRSPICGTYYKSYQEAEDARNKDIADSRRLGISVRLVDWVYRGD